MEFTVKLARDIFEVDIDTGDYKSKYRLGSVEYINTLELNRGKGLNTYTGSILKTGTRDVVVCDFSVIIGDVITVGNVSDDINVQLYSYLNDIKATTRFAIVDSTEDIVFIDISSITSDEDTCKELQSVFEKINGILIETGLLKKSAILLLFNSDAKESNVRNFYELTKSAFDYSGYANL